MACALAACDLDEVTIPTGGDMLVVEAVIRAREPVQRVLLHRTLDGSMIRGEPDAEVIVVSASGDTLAFASRPLADCIASDTVPRNTEASCYLAVDVPTDWIEPGNEYELHVRTSGGEHLFGRTHVPDDFAMVGLPQDEPDRRSYRCTLPPQQNVVLRWTESPTAAAYLSQLEITGLRDVLADTDIGDIPEPLTLTAFAVTSADTTIQLPSAYGVEERFDLDQDLLRLIQAGFPAGVQLAVVVAAGDKNLADAYREELGLTGTVRGASVAGDGTGIFGSMVPLRLDIDVADTGAAESCLREDRSRAVGHGRNAQPW